jgi:hypothetical protein
LILAERRDGFQGHVSGTLDRPFVVLLEQQGADEADEGGLVGEDADDFAVPLDFAVEAFERVCAVDLDPVLGGKAHVGQDVGLGIVHQRRESADPGPDLVGDLAPLLAGGLGIVLRKGGADPGRIIQKAQDPGLSAASYPYRCQALPSPRCIIRLYPNWESHLARAKEIRRGR